jgi:hypothetical protein
MVDMTVTWIDPPLGTTLRERRLFRFTKDYSRRSRMQGGRTIGAAGVVADSSASDLGDIDDIDIPSLHSDDSLAI